MWDPINIKSILSILSQFQEAGLEKKIRSVAGLMVSIQPPFEKIFVKLDHLRRLGSDLHLMHQVMKPPTKKH